MDYILGLLLLLSDDYGIWNHPVNIAATMDVMGSPRWHLSTDSMGEERLSWCEPVEDFIWATGSQPPAWGRCQPDSIPPPCHLLQSCISKFEGNPVYSSQGFPGLQRGKSQTTKPQLTTIMDKLTIINHPASVLGRTGRKRSANYVTFEELISVLNYNF